MMGKDMTLNADETSVIKDDNEAENIFEEGHRSFPEMLASEAATSPPQRPRLNMLHE